MLFVVSTIIALDHRSCTPGFTSAWSRKSVRSAVPIARAARGGGGLLPKLYVYDHCPFCTRARMIFGLKGIRHNLSWLANDDIQTPTGLVGKKIAPILEMPGETPMAESLDIVRRIDEDPTWGSALLQPSTGREDLKAWMKGVSGVMRLLARPRYPKGYFPEFAFQRAREAFVRNHPIADPETGVIPGKEEWLQIGPDVWNKWYAQHLENTPALLEQLNPALAELENLIHHGDSVSPGGVGYDDIAFFDRLRGTTLVKGVQLGPKATAYLKSMSHQTDIPLFWALAM